MLRLRTTPILYLVVLLAYGEDALASGFLLDHGLFTAIDYPGVPTNTIAHGINNSGQIVGTYDGFGFMRDDGVYTSLGRSGIARGINDLGQIVGYYINNRGFLYSDGVFTSVDVPGSTFTHVEDINDSGQMAGNFNGGGFLYDNGIYTAINAPGAQYTIVYGLNNASQVVGYYLDASFRTRGFLYHNGSYTTLPLPFYSTTPHDINNAGQIVGYFSECCGLVHNHGFLYNLQTGSLSTINVPGRSDTQAYALNDFGAIVGIPGPGPAVAIPEPQSLLLTACGLAGFLLKRRRSGASRSRPAAG